jgi:catechol 2,3-dioxygenase
MINAPHTVRDTAPTLPATLRLGPVHLTVTDLDRSVGFYEDAVGLVLHRRGDGAAALGAGAEDLVVLVEEPSARPAGRHAGLYHFALLHPSRLELARAARRLIASGTPISGASDHGISEAIYLPDPDGNGIELAADRPREQWSDLRDPSAIAPRPLDMQGLLALGPAEDPPEDADPGLVVGHVHLHVGDVEQGLAFYRDVLGFEPMTVFASAAFVSAGGYHHHLAFNTWRGEDVPPTPPGAAGLRQWTVLLERQSEVAEVRERLRAAGIDYEEREGGFRVRDPWDNAVLFADARPGGRA